MLIERVRAKMGRIVSHPHAIQIGASNGRITLSGPILAHEAEPLLDAVRSVWGVNDIEDHLVVYDHPESIPALQGGGRRREMRPEILQEEWTPALRVAAILGGGALAVCAIRQRGLTETMPAKATNEDAESVLDVAQQLWRTRLKDCGPVASPDGDRLRLIMEKLAE